MSDAFISYAREDLAFVRDLSAALEQRQKEVWVDWEEILPTAEWWAEIVAGIEGSDAFLFILSPDSAASEVCGREVAQASELGKRIVVVLRRDVDGIAVPPHVTDVNWLFFRPETEFADGVARVVDALDLDLPWQRSHTRWLLAALEWDRKGRDPSLLARGSELMAAEKWLGTPDAAVREPAPTPMQYDFVFASRQAATRRQRAIVSSISVALAVAVGLALLAVWQRNTAVSQRRLALSRGLLQAASGDAGRRIDVSILLTLESYRRKSTPQARDDLVAVAQRAEHLAQVLTGFSSTPRRVALSRGGNVLTVATDDGAVVQRSAATRRDLAPALADGRHETAALSRADDAVAVPVAAGLQVRRTGSAAPPATLPEHGEPVALALEDGGTRALVVTRDGRVSLWAIETGTLVGSMRVPSEVAAADVGAGSVVLAGSAGLVLVRDRPPFGAPVTLDPVPQRDVSVGGRRAAAVSVSGDVALWDLARRRSVSIPSSGEATEVALAPIGEDLAVGDRAGNVTVRNTSGAGDTVVLRGHADAVVYIAYDSTGRTLASAALDGTVDLWTPRRSPFARPLPAGADPVLDVAYSPRGDVLAASGFASSVSLWDVRAQRPTQRTIGEGVPPVGRTRIAFGAKLATATPGRVALVRAVDGAATVLARDPLAGSAVAAAPDDPMVAWASGRLVAVHADGHVRRLMVRPRPREIADLALAPGRPLLVAATDRGVYLIDPTTGKRRSTPLAGRRAVSVSFDARGDRLLAAPAEGGIVVWDVRPNRAQGVLRAENVADAALAPDGQTAAVATDDGTVRLWDVPSRTPLGAPFGSGVTTVSFAPGGGQLAAGGAGVTLWAGALWGDPRRLMLLLCPRAGRNLTRAEWREFLPGESYRSTC